MATPTFQQATYSGEAAAGYISAALLSAKTLDENAITIKPNVKYKEVIRKMDASNLVQDASCDFTDAGSVVLSERYLIPDEKQVNLVLCKSDFHADWEAISMGYSAMDVLPKTFTDYLIAQMAAHIAQNNEQYIWSELDTKFNAVGSGVINKALTGSITSANVLTNLASVVDSIPDTIYDAEDLTMYVSPKVAKAYMRYLGAENYQFQSSVEKKPLNFEGIDMFVAPGLGADQIVAGQKSNLFFATGLMSDHNEIKVIDMSDIDGSQNVRFVARFTRDVNFGIGSEIVLNR